MGKNKMKEYAEGFSFGKSIGYGLGMLAGMIKVHIGWAMFRVFGVGVTIGYILGIAH